MTRVPAQDEQSLAAITTLAAPHAPLTNDADAGERPRLAQTAAKRAMDVGLGGVLLVVLALPMLVACLLIVLVDHAWPVFADRRIGRGGRSFPCLKLRTMRNDAVSFESYLAQHPEEAERYRLTRKLEYDPRRTRLGMLLRKTSLDEAPQLLNVLAGRMSVVGPRPLGPLEFAARGSDRDALVLVKPGLTGLWQVNGRSILPVEERSRLDCYYCRHWSIALDLQILLRTPVVVLTGRGAF